MKKPNTLNAPTSKSHLHQTTAFARGSVATLLNKYLNLRKESYYKSFFPSAFL
ncbi:hypothetical protein HY772_07455 [Candidatus Woesearchaeota archaeon]|nr:hypothetical protein [Candidatus Woesearchaeota archaeon]